VISDFVSIVQDIISEALNVQNAVRAWSVLSIKEVINVSSLRIIWAKIICLLE